MLNDWLNRVQDVLSDADANDWLVAVIIGAAVQILVLLLFRILGFFFRMATWFVASLIGVAVTLYILDREGVPRSIGGGQIDRWIDDVRGYIGV
jgi:hypothetical protein